MKKDIKLSKDFKSALTNACKASANSGLNSISVHNIAYHIIQMYVPETKETPDDPFRLFLSELENKDCTLILDRAEFWFKEELDNLSNIPDKYNTDPETGLPFNSNLNDLIKDLNDNYDEVTNSLFIGRVFKDYDVYLADIDCNLDELIEDSYIESGNDKDITEDWSNGPSSGTPDDLNAFLNSLGYKRGDKKKSESQEEEDFEGGGEEDFDKAGESEAINTSKVDPNSKTPFLDQYSFDMTKAATDGKYDPVVGRDREIDQIIKILSCRKKNNAILLGDPGCGKTAIVESLAQKISRGDVPIELLGKKICSLDLNALVSGTKYRGEYEERLQGIIKEVCSNKEIIIYIDEFHNLIGNGSTSGSGDGANILKPYLARGEFQCIGSTTQEEYRKFVKDGALKRRFQSVSIEEPGISETVDILKGIAPKYEEFHRVKYSVSALKACVELSGRYINDRYFPDKAIDILDTAGAQTKLGRKRSRTDIDELKEKIEDTKRRKKEAVSSQDFEEAAKIRDEQLDEESKLSILLKEEEKQLNMRSKWPEVTVDTISSVISGITGIPIDQVNVSDIGRLKAMKSDLSSRVIGQSKAVDTFVTVLQRNYLGLRDETKCIASILLTGPSGTGKTLICEEVAKRLFGSEESFIKYNMGELTSEHEVSKLIGSPAGYIGYEDEPLLLQVKRHPSSLVLFDEIEKAHPKIFDIFLNIMDKGEITLSNGEKVDFRNTIVVFTGNIGTKDIEMAGKGIGFEKAENMDEKNKMNENIVQKAIKKTFRPEFINRLTNMITFNELSKQDLNKIFVLEFNKLKARLKSKGYTIKVTNQMRDHIVELCNPSFGARDLQRNIQKFVETEVCTAMLDGDMSDIISISVDWVEDKPIVSFAEKKE